MEDIEKEIQEMFRKNKNTKTKLKPKNKRVMGKKVKMSGSGNGDDPRAELEEISKLDAKGRARYILETKSVKQLKEMLVNDKEKLIGLIIENPKQIKVESKKKLKEDLQTIVDTLRDKVKEIKKREEQEKEHKQTGKIRNIEQLQQDPDAVKLFSENEFSQTLVLKSKGIKSAHDQWSEKELEMERLLEEKGIIDEDELDINFVSKITDVIFDNEYTDIIQDWWRGEPIMDDEGDEINEDIIEGQIQTELGDDSLEAELTLFWKKLLEAKTQNQQKKIIDRVFNNLKKKIV